MPQLQMLKKKKKIKEGKAHLTTDLKSAMIPGGNR